MWRTCPKEVGPGHEEALQEEEHSAGQASEELGEVEVWPAQDEQLEAVARWRWAR